MSFHMIQQNSDSQLSDQDRPSASLLGSVPSFQTPVRAGVQSTGANKIPSSAQGDQIGSSEDNSILSIVVASRSNNDNQSRISKFIDQGDNFYKKKSKYAGSRWKQQKIHAWRIRLTLYHLHFYFLPLGVLLQTHALILFLFVDKTRLVKYDYTDCKNSEGNNCSEVIRANPNADCNCSFVLQLKQSLIGTVYLNFEISNFYQNRRDYIESFDVDQYGGKLFDQNCKAKKPSEKCGPSIFQYDKGKIIYPCGKVGNSFCTDYVLSVEEVKDREIVQWKPIKAKGQQKHQKNMLYKSPKAEIARCGEENFKRQFTKPKAWSEDFWWEHFVANKGVANDDYIIWTRPAAFIRFRNQFKKFDGELKACNKTKGLCKGRYNVNLHYQFETKSFDGQKLLVLSKDAFAVEENHFLLYAFAIFGTIYLVLGVVFGISTWVQKSMKKNAMERRKRIMMASSTNLLASRGYSEVSSVQTQADTEIENGSGCGTPNPSRIIQ